MYALSKNISLVILLVASILMMPVKSYAHPSKYSHANEIIAALGFDYNQDIYDWLCYISSDMIDKHEPFYSRLKADFPGFTCKHRLLFHWNFNGIPWTPGLESKVVAYTRAKYGSEKYRDHISEMKEAFLIRLRKEQKRRNGLINKKTEQLFGFASGGRDASYANFFAAMAYDLHLLGDYTSGDNSDLNGLVGFETLINGLIGSINRLDAKQGKLLTKSIKRACSTNKDIQLKADDVMEIMNKMLPTFIKNAQDGSIKRRLEKRGFIFIG